MRTYRQRPWLMSPLVFLWIAAFALLFSSREANAQFPVKVKISNPLKYKVRVIYVNPETKKEQGKGFFIVPGDYSEGDSGKGATYNIRDPQDKLLQTITVTASSGVQRFVVSDTDRPSTAGFVAKLRISNNKLYNVTAVRLIYDFTPMDYGPSPDGYLGQDDIANGLPTEVHSVELLGNVRYRIDLSRGGHTYYTGRSLSLLPLVRVEDNTGRQLVASPNQGQPTTRLFFTAPRDGTYRILAIAARGSGSYRLQVATQHPVKSGEAKIVDCTLYDRFIIEKDSTSEVVQDYFVRNEESTLSVEALNFEEYHTLATPKDPVLDAIGDQGQEGACVAWAVCAALGTNVVRDYLTISTGQPPDPATFTKAGVSMFDAYALYDQRGSTSSGWWIDKALDKCVDFTVPFFYGNQQYGIRISKPAMVDGQLRKGWQIIRTRDEMRHMLFLDRPLIADFAVFNNSIRGDAVYGGPLPNSKQTGGHAVMVSGYYRPRTPFTRADMQKMDANGDGIISTDEYRKLRRGIPGDFLKRDLNSDGQLTFDDMNSYWLIQNSWGRQWGNNGFFAMKEGVCDIDDSMYMISNWYLCDRQGRQITDLKEKNRILKAAIDAIPDPGPRKYTFKVKTANTLNAGTQAPITIRVFGALGKSKTITRNGFSQGSTITFSETFPNIGEVTALDIVSTSTTDKWLCQQIEVSAEKGRNRTFNFDNKWLPPEAGKTTLWAGYRPAGLDPSVTTTGTGSAASRFAKVTPNLPGPPVDKYAALIDALAKNMVEKKIAPSILQNAPKTDKVRIGVFTMADKDGRYKVREMGSLGTLMQGEIYSALRKELEAKSNQKFRFLSPYPGLQNTFETINLDPDGMYAAGAKGARAILKQARIDIGIIGRFDFSTRSELTKAAASSGSANLTVSVIYPDKEDTFSAPIASSVLLRDTPAEYAGLGDGNNLEVRLFWKHDVNKLDSDPEAWRQLPVHDDTDGNKFVTITRSLRGKRFKVQLVRKGPAIGDVEGGPVPRMLADRMYAASVLVDGVNSIHQPTGDVYQGRIIHGPAVRHPSQAAKWVVTAPGRQLQKGPKTVMEYVQGSGFGERIPDSFGPKYGLSQRQRIRGGKLVDVGAKPGNSIVDVTGFHHDGEFVDAFTFGDTPRFLAETVGISTKLGLIEVYYYKEVLPLTTEGKGSGSPPDVSNASDVTFRLEPLPAHVVRIFYQYGETQ